MGTCLSVLIFSKSPNRGGGGGPNKPLSWRPTSADTISEMPKITRTLTCGTNERLLTETKDILAGDGQQYKLVRTGIGSSILIKPWAFKDARGSFTEFFNVDLFREAGLPHQFFQDMYSISGQGVLRGFHGDYRTTKLLTVIKGEVLAAIVDLNPDSPTYFHVYSVALNADNQRLLLVPPGFGNSFLVNSEDAVYLYKKTTHFIPGGEMTLRWDCPDLIGEFKWPVTDPQLSKRDTDCPLTRSGFEAEMQRRPDLENNPFIKARDENAQ